MLTQCQCKCNGSNHFFQQIEIVDSNPTQSMDAYVNISFVFVLSCIDGSLGTGRSPGAEPFLRSCQLRSNSRISRHFMEPEGSLPCSHEPVSWTRTIQSVPPHTVSLRSVRSFIQGIRPGPMLLEKFCNKLIFHGEELLAPRPTLKARGPPLVGWLRLLIQYNCSYPPYLDGVSSIRNLRTSHAVVTRDPQNMGPSKYSS
jgi:hypothetical protein